MPDILVVGLVHDERQLIVSAGNRNDERRFVDVFGIILRSIPQSCSKALGTIHHLDFYSPSPPSGPSEIQYDSATVRDSEIVQVRFESVLCR